jgi:hypothetical protein
MAPAFMLFERERGGGGGIWPREYGEVGYISHPQSPQERPGSSEQDRPLQGLCIPRPLPRWHDPDPLGGLSPAYIPEMLKGKARRC